MPEPNITTYTPESKRDVPDLEVEDGLDLEPVRCPNCGRFLGYQAIVAGIFRLKCRKCKLWITIETIPESTLDIFENGDYNNNEVEEDDRAEGEPQEVHDRPIEI